MPSQNAAAQTVLIGPSPSPADEKSKRAAADYLFETVSCDLHWTALQAGSIAMVVEACSKTDAGWTLKAWRRGLGDDCEVMRLALRFQDDMGLNKAIAAQIAGFYDSVRTQRQASSTSRRSPSSIPSLRGERWPKRPNDGDPCAAGPSKSSKPSTGRCRDACLPSTRKTTAPWSPSLRRRREATRDA